MRVLLTGAAGFIGSHVARQLIAHGDQVTAVLSPGRPTDRIKDVLSAVATVEADLNSADLPLLVSEAAPDTCIHLAWHVDPITYLTSVPENLASLVAGIKLLSALEEVRCPRTVIAGTCLEPGTLVDGGTGPARTVYAAAKTALHQVAMHLKGTVAACAHVFYVYGPGEDPRRVVPQIIRACLQGRSIDVSSGVQRRAFLHVEDVASAIIAVAKSNVQGSVDVCSSKTVPFLDVFRAIGAATDRADLIRVGHRPSPAGEPLDIAGNLSALVLTGWEPHWSLAAGISQTVGWWRARLADEGHGASTGPIEQAPGWV